MNVTFPYGAAHVSASLDWARCLGSLAPCPCPPLENLSRSFAEALRHPLGIQGSLKSRVSPGREVVIVVPDASRKAGVHLLMPQLLEWLHGCGVSDRAVSVLFALGVHRPVTQEEMSRVLGAEIAHRLRGRIDNHDAFDRDQLQWVGRTRAGTEVWLNRRVCSDACVILMGSVVMHYFAGFGGGRKNLVPGVAGADTIAHNHALNLDPAEMRLDPRVRIGVLDGNPVAEDLLEAARFREPDFIVNTVLDTEDRVVGLFVGDMDVAHRAACALAARLYAAPISERADLVIASVSGAANFVQSHKALFNAFEAVKDSGRVLLLAPAPEGLGGAGFREYLAMKRPEAIMASLRQRANINGQTALSTLRKSERTILVTQMSPAESDLLGVTHADSFEDALAQARGYFECNGVSRPTCYLMPNAGVTVPLLDMS